MKQLALRTTQNVVIEYPVATLFERIIAGIIDSVLVLIISWITVSLGVETFQLFKIDSFGYLFLFLMPLAILVTYHTLSEYFANGQSLGKTALGIRVVRTDGQKAGLREAIIRAFVLVIDYVFSFGIFGILAIATSRRWQRLGDMAANTVVIKSSPPKPFRLEDIVKIKSSDDYEPTYPNVIQFTEKDILQVKETLERYEKYHNKAHTDAFGILVKKLANRLEVKSLPKDKRKFIKTLIRDYIVLTR